MVVTQTAGSDSTQRLAKPVREWPAWHAALSNYREASTLQACWQLTNTVGPYAGLWILMFGLGALFSFLLRFRIPTLTVTRKERVSVLFTNFLIAGVAMMAAWSMGWRTYVFIQIPVIWMAGVAGIWLFYVQHQFEGVYWARKGDWDALRAAMEGSSFYQLPGLLRWFSGNIGYHHVHHLAARIPNYRLKACYDAIPELQAKTPLTLGRSLGAIRLKIWDEKRRELVAFPS